MKLAAVPVSAGARAPHSREEAQSDLPRAGVVVPGLRLLDEGLAGPVDALELAPSRFAGATVLTVTAGSALPATTRLVAVAGPERDLTDQLLRGAALSILTAG